VTVSFLSVKLLSTVFVSTSIFCPHFYALVKFYHGVVLIHEIWKPLLREQPGLMPNWYCMSTPRQVPSQPGNTSVRLSVVPAVAASSNNFLAIADIAAFDERLVAG
jgi:hypothetical protein